jgi:hypothetical protein
MRSLRPARRVTPRASLAQSVAESPRLQTVDAFLGNIAVRRWALPGRSGNRETATGGRRGQDRMAAPPVASSAVASSAAASPRRPGYIVRRGIVRAGSTRGVWPRQSSAMGTGEGKGSSSARSGVRPQPMEALVPEGSADPWVAFCHRPAAVTVRGR